MTTIDVREIFDVSVVDKESTWKDILNYVQNIDDEVLLLFDFVICYNPSKFNSFKELFVKDNVHMEFISSEAETSTDLANNLKLSCIMDGYKEDRFVGKQFKLKKPEVISNMTAITERISNKLYEGSVLDEENNCYNIPYEELFSQLDNPNTLSAIFKAIYDLYCNKEIKIFNILLGDFIISSEILDALAKRVVEFKNNYGISISVKLEDNDCINDYNSSLYKYNSTELNIYRKFEEFQKLNYDIAGILIKYKHTRAVDTLGREGKGKQASSRVSIFRGLATLKGYEKKVEIIPKEKLDKYTIKENCLYNELDNPININSIFIIIEDLPLKYFNTKAHFSCSDEEIDDELLDENLPFNQQKIAINNIGLYNNFVGRCYHFLKPWQEDIIESERIIKGFNSEGFTVHENVTVPQRMRIVFDDWDVNYNKDELDKSIELNNNYLIEKFGKLYND